MYRHILVTTDGTDIDHAAVRHAAALTRALGARLTLLHIVPDAHLELGSGNDLSVSAEDTEREWAQAGEHALEEGILDANCTRLTPLQRPARGRDRAPRDPGRSGRAGGRPDRHGHARTQGSIPPAAGQRGRPGRA